MAFNSGFASHHRPAGRPPASNMMGAARIQYAMNAGRYGNFSFTAAAVVPASGFAAMTQITTPQTQ